MSFLAGMLVGAVVVGALALVRIYREAEYRRYFERELKREQEASVKRIDFGSRYIEHRLSHSKEEWSRYKAHAERLAKAIESCDAVHRQAALMLYESDMNEEEFL